MKSVTKPLVADKGKGKMDDSSEKKKHAPPTGLKEIMISSPVVPVTPVPEIKEGRSDFGDDVYNPIWSIHKD